VRHEEPSSRSEIAEATTSPPASGWRARVWSGVRTWAWPATLACLATITSLALAFYASVWLVVPYLIVMGLVLDIPIPAIVRRAIRIKATVHSGSASGPVVSNAGVDRDLGETVSAVELELEPTSDIEAAASSDPDLDASLAKAKRGRGRPRKAKPLPVVEVEEQPATWVRVGPGQFVRADRLSAVLAQKEAWAVDAMERVEQAEDLGSVEESSIEDDGDAGDELVVPDVEMLGDNGIAPDVPGDETQPDEQPEATGEAVVDDWIDSEASLDSSADLFPPPQEHGFYATSASIVKPIRWLRSGRPSRIIPGFRSLPRRTARGAGRFVGVDRTHPPRSPPRSGRTRGHGQGFGLV
jgi:hypothetical protein